MTARPRLLIGRIGAIGDICMLMPLVRALAERFEVDWLIHDQHRPLVARFGPVDCRLIGVAAGPGVDEHFADGLVDDLRARRHVAFLDFSHWPCMAWLARRLTDVPVRAITRDPAQDALLGLPVPDDAEAFNCHVAVPPDLHQMAKWRLLAETALGVALDPRWPLPSRPPLPSTRRLAVFLQPLAGKPEKVWPIHSFARVLAHLSRGTGVACTVNAARGRTVNALRRRLLLSRVRFLRTPADPSFGNLRAALDGCDLAIGCDSGPMHCAALLGVPTLVVFGRYPAREFAPLWRSHAVSPDGQGEDADAVPPATVTAALDRMMALLREGQPADLGTVPR